MERENLRPQGNQSQARIFCYTSRLQFRLNGGIYYNTSVSEIGFKNMLGPQIFPELSLRISKNQGVMTYFKYSPVVVAGGIDITRNRELATGLYFRQSLKNRKSIFVGLDYAELDAVSGAKEAHTRTLSLGVGLGF